MTGSSTKTLAGTGAPVPPPPFADSAVAEAYAAFPETVRPHLLALRGLIFETASDLPQTGGLSETLKWGQPAYLTRRRAGTTLRLGVPKTGGYALFVHCQTSLIPEFRSQFPGTFRTEGNRAVLFSETESPEADALRFLIARALCYHLAPGFSGC